MKSLQRRFDNITTKNPYWSSYVCFAEAVKGQNFNKQTICRWFQKLVDKDDYARNEKKEALAHLQNLSTPTEDNQN